MPENPVSRLDIGQLLTAVEDAPPVAAADVVGELLAAELGASEVAFLIADFTGGALIRLGHASALPRTHERHTETAERVSLSGTPQGLALAAQEITVEACGQDETQVFAPVTNRGEAIGVLELRLPRPADPQTL